MAWTKIPAAAASIACAACIAAAAAVPGAEMQAAHLAKTVSGDVQFTALDDVLTDILNATLQLDSVNGIAPLLSFATGGGGDPLYAFVPTDDWPGYAALSALWNYQNLFAQGELGSDGLGGIDGFSAVPMWLTGNVLSIDAFNGIPGYVDALGGDFTGVSVFDGITSFQNFPDQGLDAFVPSDTQAGYAALSGLASYRDFVQSGGDVEKLAGIDAFSAIPNWKNFLSSGDISSNGLGGIDAFSALPVFQAALTPPEPDVTTELADEQDAGAPTTLNKTVVASESAKEPKIPVAALSSVAPPSVESPSTGSPAVTEQQPAAAEAPTGTSSTSTKQSNGSYSGVFKPNNPVVLFGTGKGGGADNGIRGWDKVANGIRGALGLPKDNSGSSDAGSSGGE
jgi:hypothetical protein